MGRLSDKRRVFVEEYLRCWNASEAARRAGYKKGAGATGHALLKNAEIRALISSRIAEMAMSADEVLLRLAAQARGDIGDIMTEEGEIDLARAKREGKTHLIKAVTYSTRFGLRVEMYSAQEALVHLGRHHGLFIDKIAPTDPTGKKSYDGFRARLASRLGEIVAEPEEEEAFGEPK